MLEYGSTELMFKDFSKQLEIKLSEEINEMIGLRRRLCTVMVPHSDLKSIKATHIKFNWQHEWSEGINRRPEIAPSVRKLPRMHVGRGSGGP